MFRQLAAAVMMAGTLTGTLTACDGGQGVTPPAASSSAPAQETTPPVEPMVKPPPTLPTPARQVQLVPAQGEWTNAVEEGRGGLRRVVVLGPANAWAVGWSNDGFEGLVEHWDGRKWNAVTPPGGRRAGLITAAASSNGELWAFEPKGRAWRRSGDG